MTDEISIMLSWFANYSNFYSVLSVLVCFCAMVVFILRLNGEILMGNTATHYNGVKEQKMVSLHNPVSVQLHGDKSSSLTAGIHLELAVTQRASISIVWGVNIQAFQKQLNETVKDIVTRFRDKELFDGKYLHITDLGSIGSEEKLSGINVKCPESVTVSALGEPPRQLYPVVLVSVLDDCDISLDFTAIVLQFTVFHLKDSVCTLDSHIVYQFLKTNHNRVLSLQPMFLVSSDQDAPSKDNESQQDSGLVSSAQTSDRNSNKQNCETCKHIKVEHIGSMQASVDNVDRCTCATRQSDSKVITEEAINGVSSQDQDRIGSQDLDRDGSQENGVIDIDDLLLNNKNSAGLDESNMCIVCQSAVIFYTLLPCRHACVCDTCIEHLDRCPMCRSYIDTYFRLHDFQQSTMFQENSDLQEDGPSLSRWQAWNQRLNEYLGFS